MSIFKKINFYLKIRPYPRRCALQLYWLIYFTGEQFKDFSQYIPIKKLIVLTHESLS